MTLLQEIQRDAADDRVSVASLLRKCQILAGRLRAEEFASWVRSELAGYSDVDPLPPYRARIRGRVIGNVANMAYRHTNATLGETMIPEEFREDFLYAELRQPVAELQELVASEHQPSRPLPPELYPLMSRNLDGGYHVTSAHVEFSRPAFVAVLDGIRSRALEFALQIEALNPAAGESSPAEPPPIPAADVHGAFTNTIYAQSVNVAQASSGVSQTTINVGSNDWNALRSVLLDAGVTEEEVADLKGAIDEDGTDGRADTLGAKVSEWLGRVTGRLARTGGAVAAGVAAHLIARAIAAYYGLN